MTAIAPWRNDMAAVTIEVLIVIEAEIASTQIIEHIVAACATYGITYKKKLLAELSEDDFAPHTLPLFIRCADPQTSLWARALVDCSKPYTYYVDDNFWRLTGTSAIADYYRHPIVRLSLEYTIKHAQMVITSSPELANFLSRFTRRITVLPAAFDFSLVRSRSSSHTDEVRIGFAGSTSRADDLSLIAPVIEPILRKYPSAVFEFAGAMPAGISTSERIRFFPYDGNYDRYMAFQKERSWAVALAPLRDHEANRCKTDNKYREYSGCGFASIYSNIPPYKDVVVDGITGLLVDNNDAAWLQAIDRLISDSEERTRIAGQAHLDARKRYATSDVARQWAELLYQVAATQPGQQRPFKVTASARKRFLALLESLRLRMSLLYAEGGVRYLAQRILHRLGRALRLVGNNS